MKVNTTINLSIKTDRTLPVLSNNVFALVALLGPIKANFSWEITIFSFVIMIALAWLLLQFLSINKQVEGVVKLENKDVEKRGMMVTLAEV